jgi:hypothetical protein
LKLLGDFGVVDFMKSITTPNNDQYITNADAFSVCKASIKSAWMKIMKTLSVSFSFLSIAPAKDAAIVESKPAPEIKSVADVILSHINNKEKISYLIFTDKAFGQALSCKFSDVKKFELNLNRLNMAANLMRAGVHREWGSQRGFFLRSVRLPVHLNLSDTQEQKFGGDYDAEHHGRIVRGRMHVILITGEGRSDEECMVIHFFFCEECQSIVITRCGAHGRTAR